MAWLIESETKDPGFPVHVVRVLKATYLEGGTWVHPEELECEVSHRGCEYRGYECIVEETISELGLHAAVYGSFHAGPERLKKGQVLYVQGWASTFDVPGEPIEYDAGIEVVESVEQ